MSRFQRIGVTLIGLLAGGLTVAAIEWVSSLLYPMPKNIDWNNRDGMAKWISTLPISAFLFVLAAWACGCFVGTYVSRRLSPERNVLPGLITWALLTFAAIGTLVTIPHPLWFWFAGIAACLVSGLAGLVLAGPPAWVVDSHREIRAPLNVVFRTLSRIDEYSKAVPGIIKVEFLSDRHDGVGTRFRETRRMNGKEVSTDLEVTELSENKSIRMVSDTGGTIWDTVFFVEEAGPLVRMNMQMHARPRQFLAKLMTPMILGMVHKAVQQDMDSLRKFCESRLSE
jgi:hypothetical protein